MRERFRNLWQAMNLEIREHKSSSLVYFTLRALVIVSMVLQFFNQNYENVFYCLLTLILLVLPSFIQVQFKIELPTTLEIIILLFIFAAEILGETQAFYLRFPMWDTILHTINGFLAAAIGFSLVDLMNSSERLEFSMSPVYMALVAFCFSMTIGVMWEFFEFAIDHLFMMDMQKDTIIHSITSVSLDPQLANQAITINNIQDVVINGQSLGLGGYLDIGLIDTMEDLFVNFIGASVFSVFGYFYIKKRGNGNFVNQFIPHKKDKKKDYLQYIKNHYHKNKEKTKKS